MSPKWKELINQLGFPPNCAHEWGTNALAIRYKVAAGPNHDPKKMPIRDAAGLCIPYNPRALPPYKPDRRKMEERHHLRCHRMSGYLYVYLGTDVEGKPLSESIHRIITLGVRGRRPDNHEVSHACHNPFCLSPRCMDWKTHRDNMLEEIPEMEWGEEDA